MDTTPREIKEIYETLKASMLQILDIDPTNGWHWIIDAQARAMETHGVLEDF